MQPAWKAGFGLVLAVIGAGVWPSPAKPPSHCRWRPAACSTSATSPAASRPRRP